MHGKLTSVKPAALQKKREVRNAVALDSEQNPVQKDDVVKVSTTNFIKVMPLFIVAQHKVIFPSQGLESGLII